VLKPLCFGIIDGKKKREMDFAKNILIGNGVIGLTFVDHFEKDPSEALNKATFANSNFGGSSRGGFSPNSVAGTASSRVRPVRSGWLATFFNPSGRGWACSFTRQSAPCFFPRKLGPGETALADHARQLGNPRLAVCNQSKTSGLNQRSPSVV